MSRTRSRKRYVALAVGVVIAGGAVAGSVVAGRFGAPEDPEAFVESLRNDPVVRVADIAARDGKPLRGVFVQVTSTGMLCLFDAPSPASPGGQGGCNSVDDPLSGGKLLASLAYDGGPGAERVSDARLIGLVSADVDAVEVLMTDGTRRDLTLRGALALASRGDGYRAFGYRFRSSDLRRGVGPAAVLALNAAGEEVGRQPTGFGG